MRRFMNTKRFNKKRILFILFLAVFFTVMLGRYLDRVPRRHYCDFRVYHHAAQVFLEQKDIFLRDEEPITAYRYSPFFAFCISPLGLVPIKTAAAIFFAFNFFSVIIFLRWSKKICVNPPISSQGTFWIYFLGTLFTSRFILLVWDSGQANLLMSALVVLALRLFTRGKEWGAAALLAGSIFIKYLPAMFVIYFICRGKFRIAILTVLFSVLYLFLPVLAVGWATNNLYLHTWWPVVMHTTFDYATYIDFKNQAISSMVLRLLTDSIYSHNFVSLGLKPALMVGYAIIAGLFVVALVPGRKKGVSNVDYALILTFMPLFNPNGWMINYVALIFPYIYLLNYLRMVRAKDVFVLICVVLCFALTSWMSQDIVGNHWENIAAENSSVTLGALFLVAALAKLKFGKNSI